MDFLNIFNLLCERVFKICRFNCSMPEKEVEGGEYHACRFIVENRSVLYRQAKVTPTKRGQFVTIWKRTGKGPIQPYDRSDKFDLFVVTVATKTALGQFVFSKEVLVKQGVLSVNGKGGKLAFRVYPPWDKVESQQAQKSQDWQSEFFAEIPKNKSLDIRKFKALYLIEKGKSTPLQLR